MSEIETTLLATLQKIGAEVDDLSPHQHLESDLGLESLMRMELATKLEKKLGIAIGDQLDGLDTVGELVDFLETRARAGVPAARMAS